MTLYQYVSLVALFVCATALGGLVILLVMRYTDGPTMEELADMAANAQDAELLDFLEKSECNLFFNEQLGAWGLLDGSDKIVATAHTVRTTLARAIEKGSPDGGDEVAAPAGQPDGPVPTASAVADPATAPATETREVSHG